MLSVQKGNVAKKQEKVTEKKTASAKDSPPALGAKTGTVAGLQPGKCVQRRLQLPKERLTNNG